LGSPDTRVYSDSNPPVLGWRSPMLSPKRGAIRSIM